MKALLWWTRFLYRRILLVALLGRKHFWRNLFSSAGFLISLTLVVAIIGLLRPLKEVVVTKLKNSLPSEVIPLKPDTSRITTSPVQFFSAKKDVAFGITSRQLAEIRRWKESQAVYASQILQTPTMANIDHPIFTKLGMYFDVLIQGVSPELVKKHLRCRQNFRAGSTDFNGTVTEVVPVVIPENFAELAFAYATIQGLPALRLSDLIGVKLQMRVGASVFRGKSQPHEFVIGEVCGFVPAGVISAIGAPLEWVENRHRKSGQPNALNSYDAVFVKAANPQDAATIRTRAARLGMRFVKPDNRYDKIYSWLDAADTVIRILAGILMLLTVIALLNSFMLLALEKKYEFGLYLVFGSSSVFIAIMMFLEGAFWGALHSVLALGLGDLLLPIIQTQMEQQPLFAGLLENTNTGLKFDIRPVERFYIIAGATVIAGISSLIPAMLLMMKGTLALVKKD